MAEITLQAQIQSLRTAVEGNLAADDQPARTQLPWQPGERVTAVVESVRPNDRALLRVGDFVFDAKLPVPPQLGQRLNLTFVAAAPRVTFALPESAEPALPVPPSPGAEISPAGRNLNALVQALVPARSAGQPGAVQDPVPLLPAPPREAAPLAAALQRSVERSGLFYESHLAEWVAGERPLAQLRDEPQGRLAPRPAVLADTGGVARMPGGIAQDALEPATEARQPAGTVPAAHAAADLDRVDPQATAQVRMQIESLDARQIVWQGLPWPGVQMEWRVDEPPEESVQPDGSVAWTSHLKLSFPVLGEVEADLVLAGNALRVHLHASERTSRDALQEAQPALENAMAAAGLRLAQVSIDE